MFGLIYRCLICEIKLPNFWIFNTKFILCLALCVPFHWPDKGDIELQRWIDYCNDDYVECETCFNIPLKPVIFTLFKHFVRFDVTLASEINRLFGTRRLQYGYFRRYRAVMKHLTDKNEFMKMRQAVCDYVDDCNRIWREPRRRVELAQALYHYYLARERKLNCAFEIFPKNGVQRFIEVFGKNTTNIADRWVQVNMNPEAMLIRILHPLGFNVPEFFAMSGFVLVQSYDGEPLYHFYNYPFFDRLRIAGNLLAAVLKFTEGYNGFRIYLTDATPDNIVVDEYRNFRVSFVDLDGVVMIDSHDNPFDVERSPVEYKKWWTIHRYERIPCDGCFAFITDDLHEHHKSDMNIYSICQILVEDLHGNSLNGFLHSVPSIFNTIYPMNPLSYLLKECMTCGSHCPNRFILAKRLLQFMNAAFNEIQFS